MRRCYNERRSCGAGVCIVRFKRHVDDGVGRWVGGRWKHCDADGAWWVKKCRVASGAWEAKGNYLTQTRLTHLLMLVPYSGGAIGEGNFQSWMLLTFCSEALYSKDGVSGELVNKRGEVIPWNQKCFSLSLPACCKSQATLSSSHFFMNSAFAQVVIAAQCATSRWNC